MYTRHFPFGLGAGIAAAVVSLLALAQPVTAQTTYSQHNLVSDIPGLADQADPLLLNAWGMAASGSSPWWVSDNHSGFATLYDFNGVIQSLVVFVPPAAGGTPPAAPTGMLFNGTTNFEVAPGTPGRFIFCSEDGTISAWANGTNAIRMVDKSASGSIYKGITLATTNGSSFLYAADFHNGKVDVFDGTFSPIVIAGGFLDPTLPAGYAPFGIRAIGGLIYVSYALQDGAGEDDVPGAGNGFVDVFDVNGQLQKRLITQGNLNSPWGLIQAPAGFGDFSGALLVGNFGDGKINAYDISTGNLLGQLQDAKGNAISISGLWDIQFGNGGRAGPTNVLYFSAGISAGDGVESHGLFGSLTAIAPVQFKPISANGLAVNLSWTGGAGPYLLQKRTSLTETSWFNVLTTPQQSAIVPADGESAYYRLVDGVSNQVTAFAALLNAASEVPTNGSLGTGVALLSIEGSNLTYNVVFSGLSSPAQAGHIHASGGPTNSVGVIIPFTVPATTAGTISGSVVLSSSQLTNIFTGRAYVNIHTPTNGAGEIRGQIMPLHVRVDVDGPSEVPNVGSSGIGSGFLTFLGSEMLYNINFARLTSSATMAHVHGPADATHTAPVLFPLSGATNTSGTLSGSQILTPTDVDKILSGNTYINIHTLTNGGGEIRGQILPQQYQVIMTAAGEGPSVVSEGFGHGLLSVAGGQLNYSFGYAGLNSPASAGHIHGPADALHTSGVIIPFSFTPGTSGTITGTATPTADILKYLVTGLTYANIHTTNYPGGEIRGQIRPRY